MIGPVASERSSDRRACLWTRVGPGVTGLFIVSTRLVDQHEMGRKGFETIGWALSSIEYYVFGKYYERDSLRRPWEHVGQSARAVVTVTVNIRPSARRYVVLV